MAIRYYLFFVILFIDAFVGAVTTMVIPSADRVGRLMVVGGDVLMLVLAASSFLRNRAFYGVKLMVVLLFVSSLTLAYNFDRFGLPAHLNGLRDPIFFFSVLVTIYDLYESKYRERFAAGMSRFIILFTAVQIPLVFIQFAQWGSGDNVGGTYGTKSGSGLVTQLVFLAAAYLIVRYGSTEDGKGFKISRAVLFFPLLIPSALNETKISFVLLPALLLMLLASRGKMYRAIPFLILGVALVYLLNFAYKETVEDTSKMFNMEYLEKYLVSNPAKHGADMPRFQRLVVMFRLMQDDYLTVVLGMGYGLVGGGNVVEASKLSVTLGYLMEGSRILLFRLWIQGGILAVGVVGVACFRYMKGRLPLRPTEGEFALFLTYSLVLMWFYNEAILDRTFALISSFMMIWVNRGGLLYEGGEPNEKEEEEAEEGEDETGSAEEPVVGT